MKKILTFIIAHEDYSSAVLQTVEKIVGLQEDVFTFSNAHDSLLILAGKIRDRIQEQKPEHIVTFVDLKGGSCWNLANLLRQEFPKLEVVSGINVAMLISYFTYRDELPFTELIKKAIQDGTRGITRLEVSA